MSSKPFPGSVNGGRSVIPPGSTNGNQRLPGSGSSIGLNSGFQTASRSKSAKSQFVLKAKIPVFRMSFSSWMLDRFWGFNTSVGLISSALPHVIN